MGGRLDPVGAPPEVDRVEVVAEDLVLAALLGDLDREDHLPVLAPQRRLVADEGVLDVLLRDRRATADTAAQLVERRAHDAGQVETGVGVERPVLRREHGLPDVRGHLVDRDDHPVALLGHEPGELAAVGVGDQRDLVVDGVVRGRDGEERVPEQEGDDGGERGDPERGGQELQHASAVPGQAGEQRQAAAGRRGAARLAAAGGPGTGPARAGSRPCPALAGRCSAVERSEHLAAQRRADRAGQRVGRGAARLRGPPADAPGRLGRQYGARGPGGWLPPADSRRPAAGMSARAGSGGRIGRSAHECPPVAGRRTDVARSNGAVPTRGAGPGRRSPDRVRAAEVPLDAETARPAHRAGPTALRVECTGTFVRMISSRGGSLIVGRQTAPDVPGFRPDDQLSRGIADRRAANRAGSAALPAG